MLFALLNTMMLFLGSCGLPNQEDLSLKETIEGTEYSITQSRRYRVLADYPSSLMVGKAGIEANEIRLFFFSRSNTQSTEIPAKKVEITAKNVVPYMPTMGHGNNNQDHKVSSIPDQPHGVAISQVYFNMQSTGSHKWVLYIDLRVDDRPEKLVIELHDVISKRDDLTEDANKSESDEDNDSSTENTWPEITEDELKITIINPPETLRPFTEDNFVKIGFFARGQAYGGIKLLQAEPWMYMIEGNDHGSEVQVEWSIDENQNHVYTLSKLKFSMPGTVFGTEMGHWVLRLKIGLRDKVLTREIRLPVVTED